MKDSLIVIDNFFNKEQLKILQDGLSTFPLRPQKTMKGDSYGFASPVIHEDEDTKWIFDTVKEKIPFIKNLKTTDASYRLRHNNKIVLPHVDEYDYIFMCYLKGEELLHNGTGLYNKSKKLDRYVGFVENRAIFFDAKTFHTDLQALGPSSKRWSLNIFYDD